MGWELGGGTNSLLCWMRYRSSWTICTEEGDGEDDENENGGSDENEEEEEEEREKDTASDRLCPTLFTRGRTEDGDWRRLVAFGALGRNMDTHQSEADGQASPIAELRETVQETLKARGV